MHQSVKCAVCCLVAVLSQIGDCDLQVGRSTGLKDGSAEDALQGRTTMPAGGGGSLLRSSRGLRLGLGAVTRTAAGSAKSRGAGQGQKSALLLSQPVQPVSPTTSQRGRDTTGRSNSEHVYILSTGTPRDGLLSCSMCQILFQHPKI